MGAGAAEGCRHCSTATSASWFRKNPPFRGAWPRSELGSGSRPGLSLIARSLRDGFALHSVETPGTFPIRGESRAGEPGSEALPEGWAIEIMTGAPTPEGCDAIVMVEGVERKGDHVTVTERAQPGQFINVRGSEARKGTVLIRSGTRLDDKPHRHAGHDRPRGDRGVSKAFGGDSFNGR